MTPEHCEEMAAHFLSEYERELAQKDPAEIGMGRIQVANAYASLGLSLRLQRIRG